MIQLIIDLAIIIVALGAGVAAVLLSLRLMTAHKINYLNTYVYYQILLFIFVLYGLLGNLFIRKVLMDINIEQNLIRSIIEFIPYLGVPVLITAWFMFIKMSLEMVGKTISSAVSFLYFGSVMLVLLAFGYLMVYHFGMGSEEAILLAAYLKPSFMALQILTLGVAFFALYVFGTNLKPLKIKHMIWQFAHINVLINCVTISMFYFSDFGLVFEKIYLVIFFAGQIPAILFLLHQLNKNFLVNSSDASISDLHADFITSYQISKREWEIVEEICDGLTNKQISEKLFISFQTVKDHTHRIYMKTGVKNRVQLVNLIGALTH